MSVTAFVRLVVRLFESLLLLKPLRYGNMNGTMLSQIVRGMFLAPQVFQKVPKNAKKSQNSIFQGAM